MLEQSEPLIQRNMTHFLTEEERGTWGKCHRPTKTEMGATQLQPGPAGHTRNSRDHEKTPTGLRGSRALLTPWFQTFCIRNCERITFCCSKPPSLWQLVLAAPETWYSTGASPSQLWPLKRGESKDPPAAVSTPNTQTWLILKYSPLKGITDSQITRVKKDNSKMNLGLLVLHSRRRLKNHGTAKKTEKRGRRGPQEPKQDRFEPQKRKPSHGSNRL